jgi:hypothetical protein
MGTYHFGTGLAKGFDLRGVISASFFRSHFFIDTVTVAARSDRAIDNDGSC